MWQRIVDLGPILRALELTPKQLKSPGRYKDLNLKRQALMYVLREDFHKSFPQIGRLAGQRHHSTVISGIRAVQKRLMSSDIDENYGMRDLIKTVRMAEPQRKCSACARDGRCWKCSNEAKKP